MCLWLHYQKGFFLLLFLWYIYFSFLVLFCVFKYHAIPSLNFNLSCFSSSESIANFDDFYGLFRDYHCGLLGYQSTKKARVMTSQGDPQPHSFFRPALFSRDATASKNAEPSGGAVLHSTYSSSFFAGNNKTAALSDSQKGKNSLAVH